MNSHNLSIPFNQYQFHFSTEQPIRLPSFPGSAWRGAFGHALLAGRGFQPRPKRFDFGRSKPKCLGQTETWGRVK